MRTVPIPDGLAEAAGGERLVIGEDDPTRDDVRPAEYVVTPSRLFPGRPCFTALVVLEAEDLEAIAAGATHLSITLDGGEVPWSIAVVTGL